MNILLDANVLLRLADATSTKHIIANRSVVELQAAGHRLWTVSQCYYEFWVVATRPIVNNGLGMSPSQSGAELDRIERFFPPLEDLSGVRDEWRHLVADHQCRGKVAHDARYVAAMRAHGLSHLMTFNVADFVRFPGIVVLDPANLSQVP